jgi:hypothetical protein
MLYGRRLTGYLFLAIAMFSFSTVSLLGQDKDKDKKEEKKEDKGSSKVTLAWKFEKGKTFYQTMTTKTKQTMKVMNNDVNQTQEQTFYFSWTPVSQEGDSWVLEQKILGVKMDIDIGGSPIKYDSTSTAANNTSNPLTEFFKALVGSTFKITLNTKTLKVTKIEGREEFIKKLVNANPQMKPLLDQILSENALKEMAEPTFAVVEEKPIAKGDNWKKETTLEMGPIGKYNNKYTYTYEGTDDKTKLDKIKVETVLTYKEPAEVAGVGGLPFKIKSADLKSSNANGTIYFDAKAGRVAKSDQSLDLKGDLSIEIGGQTTKVELSQTQKTEVSTSETDPLAAKPSK